LQFLETGVTAILNEELIATCVANASHGRRRDYHHESLGNFSADAGVHFRHDRRQSLLRRVSLREFLERQKDRGRVGLITAEKIEAGKFNGVENAGRFVPDLRYLVDDGLGAIERRRVGKLRESDGVAAILCRQKTARYYLETDGGQAK